MEAICQHTGLTFEARSKAAKNHPAVSELLSAANKRGAYQSALEAIRECRAELGTDLTIEAVENYVSAAIDGRRAEMQAERDRWNGIREARRERLNAYARGTVNTEHPDNVSNAEMMASVSEPAAISGPDVQDDI